MKKRLYISAVSFGAAAAAGAQCHSFHICAVDNDRIPFSVVVVGRSGLKLRTIAIAYLT